MKPSATQIFPSASPASFLFLLGSCLFIGFLCWALIPMHYFVDFQVDWPMLLFRSRPQIPCRDITLCLCRFQLFIPDVATSIPCRDITLCRCRFQLFVPDVATSIPCRDISSCLCSFQLVSSYVATSISCRDISSCLCSFQLVSSYVATSISCRDISLMSLQISTGVFLCRDINLLSRHQLDVFAAFNWSFFGVATSVLCYDISSCLCSFQLMVPDVATSISCRDINLMNCNLQLSTSHVFTAFN